MDCLIDIGGTNIRVGFSTDGKTLNEVIRFQTPKSHKEIVDALKSTLKGKNLTRIVIGIAGTVSRSSKMIFGTGSIELDLNTYATDLVDADQDNILVENDAALAGLAEAVIGAGKNYRKVAYITISTGVGGTLITDKKLPEPDVNFEPGHIIIEREEYNSLEEMYEGTFEDFCSGTSFERRHRVKPQLCNDPEIWQTYGENLGIGLTDISFLWEPDVIVLGGSITKKSDMFLKHTLKVLNAYNPKPLPEIRISNLGDTNVMLGGLILLQQNHASK